MQPPQPNKVFDVYLLLVMRMRTQQLLLSADMMPAPCQHGGGPHSLNVLPPAPNSGVLDLPMISAPLTSSTSTIGSSKLAMRSLYRRLPCAVPPCCVLGDFGDQSLDPRHWLPGSPDSPGAARRLCWQQCDTQTSPHA
jgi:hypothetical protein